MKKSLLQKILSISLAFVIIVTSMTWDGIAAMAQEVTTQAQTQETSEALDEDVIEEPTIDFIDPEDVTPEDVIEEELSEDKTVYDLGGSKKMEVTHSNAVRFKDGKGKWVDYDPSLVPVEEKKSEAGKVLEGYAYRNSKGDKKNYLPEKLRKDSPVRLEQDKYGISFHPVTEQTIENNVFSQIEDFSSVTVEDDTYVDAYEQESLQPLKAYIVPI